ncbi:hypothetical protein [Heyndrickxia camelliae]|uniref:Uncharacterized protein n=1 Tax=Heyndrickxia camelliae TaxID=1707093 RepID=A0A2N3LFY3_9BACI|nr:hypothetical protein [Heyndrickxia camelliae]PKR83531.1 hypothetical protein CWO92_18370 [Heyndrickxia camelliae]
MKIIDNRHLDFSNCIQIGDIVFVENGSKYIFSAPKKVCDKLEFPVVQINIDTFEIEDQISCKLLNSLKLGSNLPVGGVIKEIIKHKNVSIMLL